ncbi:hypothetical protein AMTR_s00004p00250880 [Amborella trichopoda]|uniref:Uncharacterized protein n=1 Tax=Amborella trichopoda TaxID=13333 RepID=W1NEE1_AMBTC|nr:hypothetical protein AMTR_s00004p00250880 [Amborella trichopoda]
MNDQAIERLASMGGEKIKNKRPSPLETSELEPLCEPSPRRKCVKLLGLNKWAILHPLLHMKEVVHLLLPQMLLALLLCFRFRRSVCFDPSSCSKEGGPSRVVEVSGVVSEATDEGPYVVQGAELGVEEALEQYEIAAPDDVISGVNDEGLSATQGEEPDCSEQPRDVAPSDVAEGASDEGPSTARGEKPGFMSNLGHLLLVIWPGAQTMKA